MDSLLLVMDYAQQLDRKETVVEVEVDFGFPFLQLQGSGPGSGTLESCFPTVACRI